MKKQFFLLCGLLFWWWAPCSFATVYVNNYTTPGDSIDDTDGIRAAIAALDKAGDTLVFGSGRYDISGPFPNHNFDPAANYRLLNFFRYHNLVIQGNNTRLLGRNWGTVFSFTQCSNIEVHDIQIDWRKNQSPHSAGIVKRKTNAYIDLKIEFPDVARGSLPADVIMESYAYMPAPSRPAYGGYFFQNSNQPETQALSADSMRVFVNPARINAIAVGDRVVVLHKKHGPNVTQYFETHGILLDGLTIHGGTGLGIIAQACSDIDLNNVRILPGNDGAFLSSTAAATRFISCRGSFSITNSQFRNSGDDGTNIQSEYYPITNINGNEITFVRADPGTLAYYRRPKVGDLLELGANMSSLAPKGTATITAIDNSNPSAVIATLDVAPPANVVVGDLAISLSSIPDSVYIDNLICYANRGRGIIFRSHNATIKNSRFVFISGPGVQLGPQTDYYHEGPGVKNVSIDNCLFSRCNFGHSGMGAMLTMAAPMLPGQVFSSDGIIDEVSVTNCTFQGGNANYTNKNGIQLASTNHVILENNTFDSQIEERILWDPSSTYNVRVNEHTFFASTPFATHNIPGVIQAEDFDQGGEGIAYFDFSDANVGGAKRSDEEVDVYYRGNGFDIRGIPRNEWLTWTANVGATADYNIGFTISKSQQRLKFRLYDEQLNTLAVVDTTPNNSQVFTYTAPCVSMSQGAHQFRMWADIGGFTLDSIRFSPCTNAKMAVSNLKDTGIKVYPNPVKDRLSLELPGGKRMSVVIVNAQGQTMLSQQLGTERISLEGWAAGLYFIQVGDAFRKVLLKD